MANLVWQSMPSRVVFSWGAPAALLAAIEGLGVRRALTLSTLGQRALADRMVRMLGDRAADVHAEAVMHVPVEAARAANDVAVALDAECWVAVGGGSTTAAVRRLQIVRLV